MLINPPIQIVVKNFKTKKPYVLRSGDPSFVFTQSHKHEIVECANSELIYNMLFKDRFGGRPYTEDDAERYIDISYTGWREQSYFFFVLLSEIDEIVGTLDIKSAHIESAEIGYWLSADHSGVMTNALLALIEIARKAGYQKLYANAKPDNVASQRVIQRAGFGAFEPVIKEDGMERLHAELVL